MAIVPREYPFEPEIGIIKGTTTTLTKNWFCSPPWRLVKVDVETGSGVEEQREEW